VEGLSRAVLRRVFAGAATTRANFGKPKDAKEGRTRQGPSTDIDGKALQKTPGFYGIRNAGRELLGRAALKMFESVRRPGNWRINQRPARFFGSEKQAGRRRLPVTSIRSSGTR
jgi:hypothetical protein